MLTMRDVEDIAIVRNMQEARAAGEEISEMQDDIAFARSMKLGLQEKNAQIAKLRSDLNEALNLANSRMRVLRAEHLVTKHFGSEYAKLSGKDLEEVRLVANTLRRKAIDQLVEDGLREGSLTVDPRQTGEMVEWYSTLP